MNFKEQVRRDVEQTFINITEMASAHIIESKGSKVTVYGVLTEDAFEERVSRTASDYAENVSIHGAQFSCNSDALKRDPIRGEEWIIDGVRFVVDNVENRMGIHTVKLIKNQGR